MPSAVLKMGACALSHISTTQRGKGFLFAFREAETVSEEDLAEGLRQMGYQLRPHEMRMLAEQVDLQSQSGAVSKSAFLASQIDWHQEDLRQAAYM